ncbi:mannose-6-phosphate isomerase-like protein (cupin superfamily) [Peribacillus deserti]|uniref:Mannose-6-phosphate isomerase-like protein (Cupin superfamily) n=1 Tax=Peribacillus deserti TaxID=673318 RepID=A0ABS2QJQ2_9BACI|nr:mannose-6-phosphate isomerase-like protein (cupin superfamily) [Peribacillus deserti]
MYDAPFSYSHQYQFPNPNYFNEPINNNIIQANYWTTHDVANRLDLFQSSKGRNKIGLKDYGRNPFVININAAAKQNSNYRTALWTGKYLQVTLMSLKAREDIGLEIHSNVDQFLRIEQGQGIVQMGKRKNNLNFVQNVSDDSAIMIPAGTWHNVTNTGNIPLKLYSIYAPPQHPFGTVHVTKADALVAEHHSAYGKHYSHPTKYPIRIQTNMVKNSFSKEEAAAIALLLGIDFDKSKFGLEEFLMGVNTELEHGKRSSQTNVTGDDPIITGKIALAHLNEFPDYYKRLNKLEEEAKSYWNR